MSHLTLSIEFTILTYLVSVFGVGFNYLGNNGPLHMTPYYCVTVTN